MASFFSTGFFLKLILKSQLQTEFSHQFPEPFYFLFHFSFLRINFGILCFRPQRYLFIKPAFPLVKQRLRQVVLSKCRLQSSNFYFLNNLEFLILYAIEDNKEAVKRKLDLRKGILLTGSIGCGKTSLMSLVKYFFQPGKQYQIKSTRDISFEFEKDGYKVINRYSKNPPNLSYINPVPNIFCFDDLGIEQTQKYFGNECNVMAEILLSRYDLFISKGIPTHLTTNLSASEIVEKYGNRVRSRMREMFNVVAFEKNAGDKRS